MDCQNVREGDCGGKSLWWKTKQPWKHGNTAESCVGGGAITTASLPPQASISRWTIERLVHPMPNALNYRVGPQPGAPLYAWCSKQQRRTQGKGAPQVPECAELQRKTGQRGLLIASYKRLEKRLWRRHNSCSGDSPCLCTLGATRVTAQQAAPQPPSSSTLTGAELPQEKIYGIYACRITLVMSDCLWLCRLWPARLLCQGRRFSRKEYWSMLANTSCHTLLEHYISWCPSLHLPWVPGAARTPAI